MDASSSSDHGTKHIDADLYKAVTDGDFEKLKSYSQPLDHLIFHNKNTILHLYLNSPFKRSEDFVANVLGQCPGSLLQTNNDGATPLHVAAKYGHVDIVKLFIEEAKRQNHRDLETGEEEADSIRWMLRLTNKQKETALHLATRGNSGKYVYVVKEILKHEDPHYTYTANESGETPLYLAFYKSSIHHTVANEILNKFESPYCGGPNGRTVFHAAACSYFTDIFLDLLFSKLGSFVNQADENGWTPLHYAAHVNNFELVRHILRKDKHSAYATDKERSRTALHIASCEGHVDIMKEIIAKCPACCEITDVRGWNVLHYAVISKVEAAVRAIMKNPSLVHLINERDSKGYTPLHLLVVSRASSPLLSWIYDKSPEFIEDGYESMYDITDFLPDKKIYEKETLEWMTDLGRGPLGEKIVGNLGEEKENQFKEKVIPGFEKAREAHVVAASLVATVTFAAAFTLPGGYISDERDSILKGTPILSRNVAFKTFLVTDAIALVMSTLSVLIHFLMVILGYRNRYYWLIRSAFWFIVIAMGAMVVAFVSGTYAVLAPPSKGLAIATCVIGLTFFLYMAYAIIRLTFNFAKKAEYRTSSMSESVDRLILDAPKYIFCGCNWYYYWRWPFKDGDFVAAVLEAFPRIRNRAIS
ncbi:Ankyrin repeat family protein [Euphorbia peplus]|nr:Ankyrin repeat family protein [Euphorbia peplus]